MKKKTIQTLVAIPFALTAFAFTTQANAQETVDMHRLYNPNSGEHFYTADSAEKAHLVKVGWKYEGVGWLAPKRHNASPVYRVYNPNAGDHHYTLDANEMFALVDLGWKYEGIGWYSDEQKGVKLYRAYNPNAKAGAHNYTTSLGEQKNLLKVGWKDEGTAWYGVDPNKKDEPVTPPKDNSGTVTPPKDNGGNQNQGGQTTPSNTNPDNGGTNTPPKDNAGNQNQGGQTTPPKTNPDDGGNVTPPIDGHNLAIPKNIDFDSNVISKLVFEKVNDLRKSNGLNPLIWNEEKIDFAFVRSEELSKLFSHTRPSGETLTNESAVKVNKGTTNSELADNIFEKWLNSTAHKNAMLSTGYKSYVSAFYLYNDGKWWNVTGVQHYFFK